MGSGRRIKAGQVTRGKGNTKRVPRRRALRSVETLYGARWSVVQDQRNAGHLRSEEQQKVRGNAKSR